MKSIALFLLIGFLPVFGQEISGRVLDRVSHQPIEQAVVVIELEDRGRVDSVFSTRTGNWQYELPLTAIGREAVQANRFSVTGNFPNPFNPVTRLSFQIPAAGTVQLCIYNSLGQLIEERSAWLAAGIYQIPWNARGAAGTYFYIIRFGDQQQTGKMVLLDRGWGNGLGNFSRSGSLQKPLLVPIRLICHRLGYLSDTLKVAVAGGERLDITLLSIHHDVLVIDLHNDIMEKIAEQPTYHLQTQHAFNHTDLPRLLRGGVDVQFFSIWVDPARYENAPYQQATRMIQLFKQEMADNADQIEQAFSYQDLVRITEQKKIAAVIGVEGGHAIENDRNKLLSLYQLGMRYFTITWNNSLSWAVAAKDPRSATVGLTEFGQSIIRTLDSLGVLIDVSHVGKKTIADILSITRNPIIASHSGANSVRAHYRNLDDDQLLAISGRGGVIGVIFYPTFLTYGGVTDISAVIRHIDYLVGLVGIDHVAIGSDFDGIEKTPIGLEDVSRFPDLTLALFEQGYSRQEVEKILSGNFIRIFKRVVIQ